MRRRTIALGLTAVVALGISGWAAGQYPAQYAALPAHPATARTAVELLSKPIPASAPNAEQLERGRKLVIAGDCAGCHTRAGGEPLAGGLGLETPFGVIYTPNLTPARNGGIGDITPDQFHRAMHDGIGPKGTNIYPAFPYPWFSLATRADNDAILAYLKTVPAVDYQRPPNKLSFPFNIRALIKVWNWLFFRPHHFQPDPNRSAEWNRGAYLVNGYGHCGECHTPKNFLAADKSGRQLEGGVISNWTAPNLTGSPRTGLGRWSVDDITEYLKTGRNAHAGAGASMADVVTYSTALMSDQDRRAIAVYLKSRPAKAEDEPAAPDQAAMQRGGAIYSDACASCHLDGGVGQPRFFPPLGRNAIVQQDDPTGLIHMILAGSRIAPTPSRPSPLAMPSFAWKLSDGEVADVATYLRNSWGNRASPISAGEVRKMRRTLDLRAPRYTVNSGDHG